MGVFKSRKMAKALFDGVCCKCRQPKDDLAKLADLRHQGIKTGEMFICGECLPKLRDEIGQRMIDGLMNGQSPSAAALIFIVGEP